MGFFEIYMIEKYNVKPKIPSVFISCTFYDLPVARRISRALKQKGLEVFLLRDTVGKKEPLFTRNMGEIKRCAVNGCFLLLITKHSVESMSVQSQLTKAVQANAKIIPTMLGDIKPTEVMFSIFNYKDIRYLRYEPTDEELEGFASHICECIN